MISPSAVLATIATCDRCSQPSPQTVEPAIDFDAAAALWFSLEAVASP
jgi:hypothetical protein